MQLQVTKRKDINMVSRIERRCDTTEYIDITPHHADQLTECCNILEKAGCWFEVHSGTISTPTNGVFLEADKIEALLAKHGKVVTKHKHARLVEAHYVDGEGRKPWERGHVNT